jgi:hypothetical protein
VAVLDLKALAGFAKSAGPTEEHRQAFGRTFVGSLLGQATILVSMMLLYVAVVVLLHRYAFDDLAALHASVGALAFWVIIATPIIFILFFSLLPTTWQALRERRLKALVIEGDIQFKPGYFRLYPYAAADRQTFRRLDGAEGTIVTWLKSADAPLLYLSGASGAGKSSLLAANVLPQLRDAGWTVIETRLFGDPSERLREAMLAADSRLTKRPAVELSLWGLLERAAAAPRKNRDAPLLLVIDQFEEFLILHTDEERRTFSALLSDLAKDPIDGLKILLVFRSDYRALIFKLELPPLTAGQNWQELACYDRGEATTFLQSGGRQLSSDAIEELFRGLDRIEDAPGMYRPITLNMLGMVLERMGRRLEGDPGRLIQSYLTAGITASESRDFAKPLLSQLITEAGTKEPRSEADLARLTGFEIWQVKATLADLARRGLVRRLQGATPMWEMAHDFLARVVGQLIGRLRPSILQRARPLVAPLVLVSWISLAVIALPFWITMREQLAEKELRSLGASLGLGHTGGISVSLGLYDNGTLLKAAPHIERLGATDLLLNCLNHPPVNVEDFKPLENLKSLKTLLVLDCAISSLEPVRSLVNLQFLILTDAGKITSLEPLGSLTGLRELVLNGATNISNLEPLRKITSLDNLSIEHASVMNLEPLTGMVNLNDLDVSNTPITSLEPLRKLTNLSILHITADTGINSLEPLKDLPRLQTVDIAGATNIKTLESFKGKNVEFRGASADLLATIH